MWVPCAIGKDGVGQTIAAARTLTVAHNGPRVGLAFQVACPKQPYSLLGFENKFSSHFSSSGLMEESYPQ